jgi:2,4-dienoyl-CoA reductase-like NADH-dependent reductase (Old Yellow Enzyme family)/thioredoxin reductase
VLFDPITIAGVPMRNRVMMAPMGSCQADADGFVTEQTIAYYRRRAVGGLGAITVEAALVAPETHGHEPGLHGDEFIPGLQTVADVIKGQGVAVGIQLMHPGRQVTSGPVVGPSPVPLNSVAPVPAELTVEDIGRVVALYADAAHRAQRAGFQYVEVHGAHGYLPSDFLSPLVNQRADAYGGDFDRRTRFVVELAEAIRARVDIPLFWRLSAEELRPGGFTVEDQLEVARRLAAAGVACISVSTGTWLTVGMAVAPMSIPRGHMLDYAARFKEHLDVPIIAVGRLDDPALAERVIADGMADIVLLGRGLLADPDWAQKVRQGRYEDVRPCIACNACVDLVGRGQDLRCAVNPETGRESTWVLEPAPAARSVMVVGGGPAGMTAARLARERGHAVSIWERDDRLGGKIDVASRAPSKAEVLRFLEHDARELAQIGVDIHVGVEVDADVVSAQDPDVVILAVGADPLFPPIPGVDGDGVVDAQEILYDRVVAAEGSSVAIVGGSATGCETAELLLDRGVRVTILEMTPSVGNGIEAITRRWLVKALRAAGAQILTGARVTAIEPGRVLYETSDGEPGSVEADLVALAVGWRPRGDRLAAVLDGREVVVVGDAHTPADFVAATSGGGLAALTI